MNAQIWEEVRAWEKEEKIERIAIGGRKEIKKRLKAKGIITTDEEIRITIQKEKNKLKQRRFTGALKETKRELELIIEAKGEKEEELKNLKKRHRVEKRALKKEISEYKEQLYRTQEEREQITGNKEELEKERNYYKDRETWATARIEELKKRLGIKVPKLGRRYLIESIKQYVTKLQKRGEKLLDEGSKQNTKKKCSKEKTITARQIL